MPRGGGQSKLSLTYLVNQSDPDRAIDRTNQCRRDVALSLYYAPAYAPSRPGHATDAAALAFVTSIYDAYKGKDAKGPPLDNARTVRRYFEPSLAALINHARPPPRGAASVWMLGRTMSAFG